MRRTLGLFLALPVALIMLGGTSGPAPDALVAPSPDTATSVAPAPAAAMGTTEAARDDDAVAPPTVSDPAPPAGEASDVGTTPEPDAARTRPDQPDRNEEGFVIAAVPDADGVAGSGPRWRYTIEVDPATGLDIDDVARQIRTALHDGRSWARDRTLEQVDDPARARIRIVVAVPDTVDALCARAGLRTAGIYSCWNGRFAVLNAWRWEVGAEGFDDISRYRTYLINHEFGHGLGHGHVGCPSPEATAPVMLQQSKGLAGCVANGWPYPGSSTATS